MLDPKFQTISLLVVVNFIGEKTHETLSPEWGQRPHGRGQRTNRTPELVKIIWGVFWGLFGGSLRTKNPLKIQYKIQLENKNGHETDFYKAKRRIDDMNLHKKTRRIQLE